MRVCRCSCGCIMLALDAWCPSSRCTLSTAGTWTTTLTATCWQHAALTRPCTCCGTKSRHHLPLDADCVVMLLLQTILCHASLLSQHLRLHHCHACVHENAGAISSQPLQRSVAKPPQRDEAMPNPRAQPPDCLSPLLRSPHPKVTPFSHSEHALHLELALLHQRLHAQQHEANGQALRC